MESTGSSTGTAVPLPPVPEVIRLSGKDRYLTSLAIANRVKTLMGAEKFGAVVVTSGEKFPDALAGSYLASVKNAPILLTKPSKDADVLAYIQENLLPGGKVYIWAVRQRFLRHLRTDWYPPGLRMNV